MPWRYLLALEKEACIGGVCVISLRVQEIVCVLNHIRIVGVLLHHPHLQVCLLEYIQLLLLRAQFLVVQRVLGCLLPCA
jgi:hypothetical protein